MASFRFLALHAIFVAASAEHICLLQVSANAAEIREDDEATKPHRHHKAEHANRVKVITEAGTVQWTEFKLKYSAGWAAGVKQRFTSLTEAQNKCVTLGIDYCQAVTCNTDGKCSVRSSSTLRNSPFQETTYLISGTQLATTCTAEGGCAIYDDQHVRVFDGPKISLLQGEYDVDADEVPGMNERLIRHMTRESSGDLWLVKSPLVHIQARFLPGENHPNIIKIRSLAVGGQFLNGSKLVIEPLDGTVTWDGTEILSEPDSEFIADGVISAQRHNLSCMVERMSERIPGMDIKLPRGVQLTVNRLAKHVNVHISMPAMRDGQGGLCGNNNGDSSDDNVELMIEKIPPIILPEDALIPPISQSIFQRLYSFLWNHLSN